MGSQIRKVISVTAVIALTGYFAWYLIVHRPSADVVSDARCTDGTATCFDASSFAGNSENGADLDGGNVVIDAALGLRLATVSEADATATVDETNSTTVLTEEDQRRRIHERFIIIGPRCDFAAAFGEPEQTEAELLASISIDSAPEYLAKLDPSQLSSEASDFIRTFFAQERTKFDGAVQSIGIDPAGDLAGVSIFSGIFAKSGVPESGVSLLGVVTSTGELVSVSETPYNCARSGF